MFGLFKAQAPEAFLTGRHITLRLPLLRDCDEWQMLRQQSRAELEPYEPRWETNKLSRAAFGVQVRQAKMLAENGEAFQFLIFQAGPSALLGGITLGNIRRGASQTGEIGYWLGTRYYRQGFMRDAVSTVLAYAFSTLHLHRVEAACIEGNTRSIALLQHCGFQHEGVARAYLEINGSRQDHHLYACLPSDTQHHAK